MTERHNNNRYTPVNQLAAVQHARRLYEELHRLAKDEELEGTTVRVFRGKYGEVYDSLGIPRIHYGGILKVLTLGGSIEYVVRAARGRDGVVVLNRPPSDADAELLPRKALTSLQGDATIQRLAQNEEALARLTAWQESFSGMNVVNAMRNFEQRIAALEAAMLGEKNAAQAPKQRKARSSSK